ERAIQLRAVRRVDPVLDLRLLFQERLHLPGIERRAESLADGVVPIQERPRLPDSLLDVPQDRLLGIEPRLLGQEAGADPPGRERLAEEPAVLAGHDAQERALARPVRADDADLRPEEERQVDPLQDLASRRDDLAQVLHLKDVFGHCPVSAMAAELETHIRGAQRVAYPPPRDAPAVRPAPP